MSAGADTTLAQAVYLSGKFETRALCSGLSRCGRCRMRFISEAPAPTDVELAVLGPADLDSGWRLGCRRPAESGMVVELPGRPADRESPKSRVLEDTDSILAVDLGTTGIDWSLVDGQRRLMSGGMLNPQLGAGSEVMSRLAFAAKGQNAELLQNLVIDALEDIIKETGMPGGMVISANQAMTCLLTGAPVQSISAAPYRLCHAGGLWVNLDRGLPEAYILPQISPFVGGDAVAGIVAMRYSPDPPEPPYMLIDMGTNGEFVMALPGGRFLAASVPLGPALEGVALSCGSVFWEGAVTGFDFGPNGLVARDGGLRPEGITGTGYVSLLARLASAGVLDENGRFSAGETPLARRAAFSEDFSGKRMDLPGGLYLTARDVEEVLKLKAAFNVAFSELISGAGLGPKDLKAILLSGALGHHAGPRDLETLGFLPEGSARAVHAAGNTSLRGAEICAVRAEARAYAEEIPKSTEVVNLTESKNFAEKYVHAMKFKFVS